MASSEETPGVVLPIPHTRYHAYRPTPNRDFLCSMGLGRLPRFTRHVCATCDTLASDFTSRGRFANICPGRRDGGTVPAQGDPMETSSKTTLLAAACSMVTIALTGCTALGPMPATTAVAPLPAGRPSFEVQVGALPGYYLSSSVQQESKK